MKRVGSIKQAFRSQQQSKSVEPPQQDSVNNNDNMAKMSENQNQVNSLSILGNSANNNSGGGSSSSGKAEFHFPKSISSFLKKGTNTLTRKKEKRDSFVSLKLY